MARGFDAMRNLAPFAKQIKEDGYGFVCRYIFKSSGIKTLLTRDESVQLSKEGLYIVTIYENGFPTKGSYFTSDTAHLDSYWAVLRAISAEQETRSPIYFAVDGDVSPADVEYYFAIVHCYLESHGFKTGVYGSGAVCKFLMEKGLVSHTMLSQSKGFPGYHDWLGKANIVQGPESSYRGIDVDWDTSNGNAGGWQIK